MHRGRGGGEGVRTRDHLASTRTTLSLIRLSVALIAAGYAIDKLGAREYALASAAVGIAFLPLVLVRHIWQRTRIESALLASETRVELVLVGFAGAAALASLSILALTR